MTEMQRPCSLASPVRHARRAAVAAPTARGLLQQARRLPGASDDQRSGGRDLHEAVQRGAFFSSPSFDFR